MGLISVCNGLGRVIFGALLDKAGRKMTMFSVACALVLGAVLLCLSLPAASPVLLVAGFIFTGLGYGGGPTMTAAVTKQFYGQHSYPLNLSITNTNILAASFAGTAAGAIYDVMGSYTAVFVLLFLLLALSFAFLFAIRKP